MAIEFTFCSVFLEKINASTELFMNDTLSNIMNAMRPFATIVMMCYLGWVGINMFLGRNLNETIHDVFWRLIKLSIVFAFVTSPSVYYQYIGQPLWQLPEALAGLIANGNANDSGHFLDTLLSQFYETRNLLAVAAQQNSVMGIPNIDFLVAGWLELGLGVVLILFAMLILVMSKFGLAIILAVAPIFILTIDFQSTRKFFDAWAGQVLTYSFTVMFLAAVIKLILEQLQSYLTAATSLMAAEPTIDQFVPVFLAQGIGIIILAQVSAKASALGGGIAISSLGAVGNAVSRFEKTIGRTKSSKNQSAQNSTTNSISDTSNKKPVGINNKPKRKD